MSDYTRSRVVSVRIEPELLEAVQDRARAEGRSVSGEIVHIVRERVEARPAPKQKPSAITGWLRHLDRPDADSAPRGGRNVASEQLLRAIGRRARRK